MALAQNITVIPARRTVGTQKPAAKVQKTRVAEYPQNLKNRNPATTFRSSITPLTLTAIPSGSLSRFMLMTVLPVPTQRSATSLTA